MGDCLVRCQTAWEDVKIELVIKEAIERLNNDLRAYFSERGFQDGDRLDFFDFERRDSCNTSQYHMAKSERGETKFIPNYEDGG